MRTLALLLACWVFAVCGVRVRKQIQGGSHITNYSFHEAVDAFFRLKQIESNQHCIESVQLKSLAGLLLRLDSPKSGFQTFSPIASSPTLTRLTRCGDAGDVPQRLQSKGQAWRRKAQRSIPAVSMAGVSTHEHVHKVYIEDTDCYDVVFYANYFRFCANARWAASGDVSSGSQLLKPVVQITNAKYSGPAKLGTSLRITTTFDKDSGVVSHVLTDANSDEQLWSSELQLAMPDDTPVKVDMPPMAVPGANEYVVKTEITAYPDDVGRDGKASETDVLRWFERCRTDFCGGASGLAALKEAGVFVVVAKIAKGVFDVEKLNVLGKKLCVRSVVKVLRKGAMIKFTQQLLDLPTGGEEEANVLASAEITCTSISAADGAISALPQATMDALASLAETS